MENLSEIITALSKEEKRTYKLHVGRYEQETERKDIALFDQINKNPEVGDEQLAHSLYGKSGDKNAYYRLKNRVINDISKSVYLLLHDKRNDTRVYTYYNLYNHFYERKQFGVAWYWLRRSGKIAGENEMYELLDLIYAGFIKLSTDLDDIDPLKYISLRKENSEKLSAIRDIDQVLAVVEYRLKRSQNMIGKDQTLMEWIKQTIDEFSSLGGLDQNKSLQTRLFRAVSQWLILNQDFKGLYRFATESYEQFEQAHWFDKNNHELKIQMIIYCINAAFKNAAYNQSLNHVETLLNALKAYDSILYDKYMFFYFNSLVINYAQLDIDKALRSLQEFEKQLGLKKISTYDHFVYLNKATLLFNKGKFDEAIRNLYRLYVSEQFIRSDKGFRIKVHLAEQIMQFESGDLEALKRGIVQLEQEINSNQDKTLFKREWELLNVLKKLSKKSPDGFPEGTQEQIHRFMGLSFTEQEREGDVISYDNWLERLLQQMKRKRKTS